MKLQHFLSNIHEFFFSWTIFGLHSLGFLGVWHTCIGLCMHFLYISSILGELVLVFLWESENTFRLNFDFGRNVRARGQTTTEKPIRPRRFPVLKLNWTVCTIYRFLSYFWFFVITGPDWRPVPGWIGWTGQSSPVFKTMGKSFTTNALTLEHQSQVMWILSKILLLIWW